MFKSVSLGAVALTFLSQDAQAVKSSYRPTKGSTPWYKQPLGPTWQEPTWPVNYFVPNFGDDRDDVLVTRSNLAKAETQIGTKLNATFDKPVVPPREYFVPNFGVDHDIKMTDLNIGEAEVQHDHTLTVEEKAKEIPRNYFVPNFGMDKEIIAAQQHIVNAEVQLDHKWTGDNLKQPKPHPTNYFVPNFGMDNEIVTSISNEALSSQNLNHNWTVDVDTSALQLDEQLDQSVYLDSDPICSTAGCVQYNHPKTNATVIPRDYFVPNFGKDNDVVGTANSLNIAEKQIKHKLVMGTDESRAKYHNAAKDTQYNFEPKLDKDVITTQNSLQSTEALLGKQFNVQMDASSDPICSSAGCFQYNHPKTNATVIPRDYFVPNFGKDNDIVGTANSVAIAEKQLKHKLIMGTPESRAKYHNAAKDTLYDYAPKLDKDVITTQKNLKSTEELLGKEFNVQVDASSDPICSSAGCFQYNHPKTNATVIPRDYFVPNFGKDNDIVGTANSVAIAEKQLKHKLIMATPESRAKYHNKAKDTLYDYNPKLDSDVIVSSKNLVNAEELLGKKYGVDAV